MTGKRFLDTNILVYARDTSAARKREIASAIVTETFGDGSARTSRQVLHEFYVTVTRKLRPGLSAEEARSATEALEALEPYPMDQALLREAWRIEDRHSLSFWDAMVVAAAELSECETLYSEDMSHGAQYDGVRIVNPFR
jgi:predicted nucleic acid-binding protein